MPGLPMRAFASDGDGSAGFPGIAGEQKKDGRSDQMTLAAAWIAIACGRPYS